VAWAQQPAMPVAGFLQSGMRPLVGIIISLMASLPASISLAGVPLPRSVLVLDQFELASPLGSAIFSGFRSTLNEETTTPLSIYVESLDLTVS
jgi:hypothetical protein